MDAVVVDIGNTAIKVGLFYKAELIEKHTVVSLEEAKDVLKKKRFAHLVISSVGRISTASASEWLHDIARSTLLISPQTPLPFTSVYETKETLGSDRIAAVAGAYSIFPNKNCLVIDIGTALKLDFIDKQGIYQGGSISPGLKLRLSSLHQFTAHLPLLKPSVVNYFIGTSTSSCMLSGVMNGAIAEINGLIERYKELFGSLQIIITGGDAHFFESKLKHAIFAEPDLVLKGLHYILQHTIKN